MNLKTLRIITGLTQQQAADKLHISVETLRAIEQGKRKPGHFLALKMARMYGVTIRDVIT